MMDSIAGYDKWLETPGEIMTDDEIRILERNLAECPFCLRHPFFEDSAETNDVFVSCHCGASIRGRDWYEASASWNIRPTIPSKSGVRSVHREIWTGY